jgi:hypothetical protein
MSDKKDTGTDRRTLIAAAAAAGVAAAGAAKALNPQPLPPKPLPPFTQIKVDLGGVRLPEGIARQLEQQINRDVLGAIGRAGIKGNVVRPGQLGPGIYGIIYRPVNLPRELAPPPPG